MDIELKTALDGFQSATKAMFEDLKGQVAGIQKQCDGLEVKISKPGVGGFDGASALVTELKSNTEIERLLGGRNRGGTRFTLSGKAFNDLLGLERKAISSSGVGGFGTPGVMPVERDGIVGMATPALHMLDVLPVRPTTMGEIMWVKETARPTKASPVTEYTGLKPLVEPQFSTDTEQVQTIACLMLASKQVIDDWPDLESFLRTEGRNRIMEELDLQILSGSGVAPNLNGLITQATAFDLTLLTASDGYEFPDIISAARQQVAEADEIMDRPFCVMHPGDAYKIRRLKTTTGEYLYNQVGPLNLFGAPVVETTQITKGTFLVGSGDPRAAEYRNRQDLTVEISTEDSTNFRYNLVTIRFELRGALVVKRTGSFITGNLVQSPA